MRQIFKFMFFCLPGFKPYIFGRFQFYGPPDFIENCKLAMNEELPKYDSELKDLFLEQNMKLTFFYHTKGDDNWPTAGMYVIPEHVWRHGSEGICQHIVYAFFRSTCTGVGFSAAITLYPRRKTVFTVREKMITWLKEVKYPQGWTKCYVLK